ncbi:unnamed protein product [Oppiella nova]|uniref:Uncharacterized protein n=1 Tax=Oppiella nova TaxID=334625 RepID=A0A7R9MC51_9ACAR|nr:unnamed protein product [Oppiella nova]CAG2174664.1 unnamed protein product [Oppiella nova]
MRRFVRLTPRSDTHLNDTFPPLLRTDSNRMDHTALSDLRQVLAKVLDENPLQATNQCLQPLQTSHLAAEQVMDAIHELQAWVCTDGLLNRNTLCLPIDNPIREPLMKAMESFAKYGPQKVSKWEPVVRDILLRDHIRQRNKLAVPSRKEVESLSIFTSPSVCESPSLSIFKSPPVRKSSSLFSCTRQLGSSGGSVSIDTGLGLSVSPSHWNISAANDWNWRSETDINAL